MGIMPYIEDYNFQYAPRAIQSFHTTFTETRIYFNISDLMK